MKKIILLLAFYNMGNALKAQDNISTEANEVKPLAIQKLCGCFEVNFKYAETFSPNKDYKYHDREETGPVIELALPIEVNEHKIIIQHLLVVSPKYIVKHWREDWTYENPEIWEYQGNKTWVKKTLPLEEVKGKWTQSVWEVSDEPRYQAVGDIVKTKQDFLWHSTSNAPLPRREYTKRSDYQILQRTNSIRINNTGYLHEQDNKKIVIGEGNENKLLVEEKGLNTYKKVDDSQCEIALEYWKKQNAFWTVVRKVWDNHLKTANKITLKDKVEDKKLYENLNLLAEEYEVKKISEKEIYESIDKHISKYLITEML